MNHPLIAIVNDSPVLVRMLATILTRAGYRTISHRRGAGTFTLLQQVQPALLILDIKMELLDSGWQVLDELRGDPAMQRLPVLIYSADPGVEAQVQARADPHCAVLPLFFDHATLPTLIEAMIVR
jgi:CheY-like chemotaxis protein